jgi:hypothetical protein
MSTYTDLLRDFIVTERQELEDRDVDGKIALNLAFSVRRMKIKTVLIFLRF